MKSYKEFIKGALLVISGVLAFSSANAATIQATNYETLTDIDLGLVSTASGYDLDLTAFTIVSSTNIGINETFFLRTNDGSGTLSIGTLLFADVSNFVVTPGLFDSGVFNADLTYTGGSMMGTYTIGTLTGNYLSSGAVLVDVFEVQAVPVPAAVWLFGSGLLGLVGIARRKSA